MTVCLHELHQDLARRHGNGPRWLERGSEGRGSFRWLYSVEELEFDLHRSRKRDAVVAGEHPGSHWLGVAGIKVALRASSSLH